MLSNYVITTQKFVLIIDELNRERIAQKFIAQLLSEQGKDDPPSANLTLPSGSELKDINIFKNLVENTTDQSSGDHSSAPLNVILPTLADWLNYTELHLIYRIIHKLRKCAHIRRVFLWISPQHVNHTHVAYVLAGFKHLAELTVHIESEEELSIITRRPGGSVSNKRYNCVVTKSEFLVTPVKSEKGDTTKAPQKPTEPTKSASDTFKIELEEDEMVARNALTLPYEKTSQTGGGAIICTPENSFYSDESEDEEDWTNMYI